MLIAKLEKKPNFRTENVDRIDEKNNFVEWPKFVVESRMATEKTHTQLLFASCRTPHTGCFPFQNE